MCMVIKWRNGEFIVFEAGHIKAIESYGACGIWTLPSWDIEQTQTDYWSELTS